MRFHPIGDILGWIFGHHPRPAPPVPTPPPMPVPPAPVPAPPPPPGPPPNGPPIDQSTALALFRAINAARAAHGLPVLAISPMVSQVSTLWAMQMARTGVLDHGDFFGRIATVAPNRAAGETIGENYPTAQAEVQGWLDSPGHRAIMLGEYSAVGCGVGVGRDGSFWFVADFVS